MKFMSNTLPTPGLEITTTLGCSVGCNYCPQDTLLKSKLSHKHRFLKFSDFRKVCEKLPKPFRLHFTGFGEPFRNQTCAEMIRYAFKCGFQLKLSTTLSGFKERDIDLFTTRMFFRTILHLPSSDRLMNLAVTNEYVAILSRVLKTLTSGDLIITFGRQFHEEIDDVVREHASRVETKIITPENENWYTRAGNNTLFKKVPQLSNYTAIRCSKDRFYQNVMLPDGTVVLCCMDWSGRHILGNILMQSYEDLITGKEMQRVRRGLNDNTSETLCWKCEYGLPI